MLTSHRTGGFATTSAPEGFDLQDFEEAGLRAVERRFGPRDTIFTPGDPDDQLYFLLSGTVRLYKIYGDYKEATTALLKDGGVFGKLNLVQGRWQSEEFYRAGHQGRPRLRPQALLLALREAQAVRRGHREPAPQGGLDPIGDVAHQPGRSLRREKRGGHPYRRAPHAPGSRQHDRLHQGGRLQGDERVPARRPDREPQPQGGYRGWRRPGRTRLAVDGPDHRRPDRDIEGTPGLWPRLSGVAVDEFLETLCVGGRILILVWSTHLR